MRKTVYLHIGAHKTGTTSIQAFFYRNRPALEAQGFLYPSAFSNEFAHHRLYFQLKGGDRRLAPDGPGLEEEFQRLIAEIDSSPAPSVILSSEGLFNLAGDGARRLAEELSRYDVRVLAVIRRPDRLFESAYNQKMKNIKNRFCAPHERFLGDPLSLVRDLRFDRALDIWAQTFGHQNLVVRRYEERADIIDLMADLIGFTRKGLAEPVRRNNEGLSIKAAELVRHGKSRGFDAATLGLLVEFSRMRYPKAEEQGGLLAPRERLAILRHCDPVTERTFERFLGLPNAYASSHFTETDFPPQARLEPAEAEAIIAELEDSVVD